MSDLLQEQIEYYRARAPEYDDWFYRRERYDQGEAHRRQWQLEAQRVRDRLHSVADFDHILEMAPGTGIWTAELAQIGERVTALDASPEMININRAKLLSDRVDYQLTDLFDYQPERRYDMVFFGFWLSHVPADRLSRFLETVYAALKPGGRLFLVDSREVDLSKNRTGTENLGAERQRRVLGDGRQFNIVKIYYDPAELTEILRAHGFDIEVKRTENFFIYADGRKLA
jgi:demethylmenaquinone methyltransferase/2-methoxy-6-polyprenyl-1,4-benzoquinol methylase